MDDAIPPLCETIAAWLQDQGHKAVVDARDSERAQILFRSRGLRFAVRVDENDPHFLHIVVFLDVPESVVHELILRRAAGLVESRAKVVKVEVHWTRRMLVLGAEQLVAEPGGPWVFWRLVALLEDAIRLMREAIDEEAGRFAAACFTRELERDLAPKTSDRTADAPTEDAA